MAITAEWAINQLYSSYGKFGVSKDLITRLFNDGIEQQGFTPIITYNLLRMSLGKEFKQHEYFSLEDVMAITGESREELLQRIEQCRQELIEAGENPDDYFKPVEPQKAAVYYFPNGLH
ncbi:MAG: hypothetical protein HDR12_13955 [Lachnospiraceae bacterium]|nr:hypothetical protein [Lachnospiraceae bacterium]